MRWTSTQLLRSSIILFAFALSGCRSPIVPERISPHLPQSTLSTSPDRPVIFVAEFEDSRPGSSRAESHPKLRPYFLGVGRRGEVRTGDESFLNPIAVGMRADAIATLERLERFVIRTDPARASDADYILQANIEGFEGLQTQHSTFSPVFLGALRRRFDPPIGWIRVHYRLHGQKELIWEDHTQMMLEAPGATITRAALDAMAKANEHMAIAIYAATSPATREVSDLPLQVLDGCGWGPYRVRSKIREASEVFERNAETRLVPYVARRTWNKEGQDLQAFLETLEAEVPPSRGVVLALIPREQLQKRLLDRRRYGLAVPLGRHAAIACGIDGEILTSTLVHEIAHLLGAVHVRNRNSIMNPRADFDGRFFDRLNLRILKQMAKQRSDRPIARERVERLKTIYAAASGYPDQVHLESVQSALDALERRSAR